VKVLIPSEELQAKVDELASAIREDYEGKCPILVCVLKGAIFFMADLARRLPFDLEVEFMAVSSYGQSTDSSGVVRILKDLDIDIEGRHILIVEDIIDSGLTLQYLTNNLVSRNPASIEIVTLLSKPARRTADLRCRYTGFEIPNEFVVGYGLDYAEKYRNLPYIGVVDESDGPPCGSISGPDTTSFGV
jgi:hypoxanthine phosphoribosyltransferase